MEKLKAFFKRNQLHFLAIGIFIIVCMVLFKTQLSGYTLRQHDIEMYSGSAHEAADYKDQTGEQAKWSNSMFGGMPTTQTSLQHTSNVFVVAFGKFMTLIPHPMGMILVLFIGAYIGLCLMKVNKWIAIFGALSLGLMSYNFMIYTAGHNAKVAAFAFMLPTLGAFWYAYRTNWKLGAIYSLIFMSFEIAMNHVQMTYYFAFLLVALGISEFIRSIIGKQIKTFVFATVGLFLAYGLAVLVNASLLFSTSDYLQYTTRGGNDIDRAPTGLVTSSNATTGLEKDYITQYSNQPEETFTLISPYVKGVGDFKITAGMSTFEDKTLDYSETVQNSGIYWGENPMVYLGILIVLLAILAFIYVKDISRWFFLATAVLAILLSWGKFNMDFVEWFIDNLPLYNKFRATTVIVMIVQIIAVVLACFSVQALITHQEAIKEKFKPFMITVGGAALVLIALLYTRDFKLYSDREKSMFEGDGSEIVDNVKGQVMQMNPEQAAQYQINLKDPNSIQAFAQAQADSQMETYREVLDFRKEVISSSNSRVVMILLLGVLALVLFGLKVVPNWASLGIIGVVTLFDLGAVMSNYMNDSESLAENPNDPSKSRMLTEDYRFYKTKAHRQYPLQPNSGDLQILAMETSMNPSLKSKVNAAYKKGESLAAEISEESSDVQPIAYAHAFSALNFNTNYRVLDLTDNSFSSATASYYHKSIGGYHGAKLRNIQNLIDFHLQRSNNKVFDMLNIKYIIQVGDSGIVANPNMTACGNAWFVQKIKTVSTPYDEITALGSKFVLKNAGKGQFIVNGEVKKDATIFGAEKLQYFIPGMDTLTVPLSNGIPLGVDVTFAMDQNGKADLMMKAGLMSDSLRSFQSLVDLRVVSQFNPQTEAILLNSEASKLKNGKSGGEGTIKMTKYSPDKLIYSANVKKAGLAIFSEIYYPEGWTAKVNGKEMPIHKVNYLLRGLDLPKGKYTIEFSYSDEKFESSQNISLIMSVIALLISIGGIYFFSRKKQVVE